MKEGPSEAGFQEQAQATFTFLWVWKNDRMPSTARIYGEF